MVRDLFAPTHLLIILIIVLVIFGGSKLPDLARGTGQALRIFRAETRGLQDDEEKAKNEANGTATAELEAKKADLEARQAELDAERAKLNRPS